MTARPQIGDWRYFVEYLDHAQGVKAIKDGGGDPENDGMWDFCDQGEITVRRPFPTKSKAAAWAQRNRKLDVFNMPRIVEETLTEARWSDTGERIPGRAATWEQSGYWETDGQTEIEEQAS